MNLLLLNYEYPPLGGGAGRAMQSLAKKFSAMGDNVEIITSNTSFKFSKVQDQGLKIYMVPSLRKGIHDSGLRGALTYLFFAYFKLLKLSYQNKYDIIHYYFSLPTAFLSILPGKHRKLPYIVSLRGSDVPKYDVYNKKLNLLHKIYLPITKHIWKKANAVIAVTTSLKQIALRTNPNQKIEVIPNGINTNVFSPSAEHIQNNGEFRLITVSRLIKRKGIQNVLKALAEIRKSLPPGKGNVINFTIIGEGNYESELKTMTNKLGLNNVVRFLGYLPTNDIPSYFRQSDAFILPSLAEAFGNVVAEAMACGLPIIGADEGGIPDLVNEENGILVQPENISQIKSAIITMINDKEMRLKMSNTNVKKIAQNYNWDAIAIAYKDIYMKNVNGYYNNKS
jgi:L-malate glycosyltransferase